MKLKSAKIIFFPIIFIIFGLSQVSEAFNFSNSINLTNETKNQIAKEGSGGKKSGGNKSGGKKSGGNKSGGKKSGGNKSGGKKSGGNKSGGNKSGGNKSEDNKIKGVEIKKQTSFNKFKSNYEAMRESAKARYENWQENKKLKVD